MSVFCESCNALRSELARVEEEKAEALGYGSRLFKSLAPQCEPLDTVAGVLTQIDNYIVGLRSERDALAGRVRELEKQPHIIEDLTMQTFGNGTEAERLDSIYARVRAALAPKEPRDE